MNPLLVLGTLLALVALATVTGLLWRARTGRVRSSNDQETVVNIAELAPGASAGAAVTLLQFSTSVCAPCHVTHSLLNQLADEFEGVSHVDIDITRRADLASRYRLLQSPTTFILDERGLVRARIGGAPRGADVTAEIERILRLSSVPA